jgi:hypothetical protein
MSTEDSAGNKSAGTTEEEQTEYEKVDADTPIKFHVEMEFRNIEHSDSGIDITTTYFNEVGLGADQSEKIPMSEALDSINTVVENYAEEGYDEVSVDVMNEEAVYENRHGNPQQYLTVEDIRRESREWDLELTDCELVDYMEEVEPDTLVRLGSGPTMNQTGWLVEQYIEQNELDDPDLRMQNPGSALQAALQHLIDEGITWVLEKNGMSHEDLWEEKEDPDSMSGKRLVFHAEEADLQDPDRFRWVGEDQ